VIEALPFFSELRVLAVHFVIERGSFHGPGAALAPFRDGHLLDQIHFDVTLRLEMIDITAESLLEAGGCFDW
jgi:hypothetical protein